MRGQSKSESAPARSETAPAKSETAPARSETALQSASEIQSGSATSEMQKKVKVEKASARSNGTPVVPSRSAVSERKTRETAITVSLALDGSGSGRAETGVAF